MTRGEAASRSRRYLALATAYEGAASAMAASPEFDRLRLPFFAALGQALELALKAAIARRGCDDERLLLLGHDLLRCWDLAQADPAVAQGSADDVARVVEGLAAPHQAQAFRYPTLPTWPLPDPQAALLAVQALLQAAPGRADLPFGEAAASRAEPPPERPSLAVEYFSPSQGLRP
jgi:hypothetical protein